MKFPELSFATPRKLPRADELRGRVVVLDIAFAASGSGASFEKVTLPLIEGLGKRLIKWVDHHDHELHPNYATDSRFLLAKKSQHGACPEMVTEPLVEACGQVDTVVCHTDFDGLCAAAKWIRGGKEPYLGSDDDARAIDTRIGKASEIGAAIDQALRARPKDVGLRGQVVRFLVDGANDKLMFHRLELAAMEIKRLEDEARKLSVKFEVSSGLAVIDVGNNPAPYEKTYLLLLGQERARVSVVADRTTVTAAANFESGIDLLKILGIEGGMPTRVSLPRAKLDSMLAALRSANLG